MDRISQGESLRDLTATTEGSIAIVKFSKGLTILRSLVSQPRTQPPIVLWLHGDSGTGKTRSAFEFGLEKYGTSDNIWTSNGSLQWFDGYDGQPIAIFDDFRTNHCSFSFLLRVLDRYPLSVPFKGGFVNWNPTYIIITTFSPPQEMFNLKNNGDITQLKRRISHVVPFGSGIESPPLGTLGLDGSVAPIAISPLVISAEVIEIFSSEEEDILECEPTIPYSSSSESTTEDNNKND